MKWNGSTEYEIEKSEKEKYINYGSSENNISVVIKI